MVAPLTRYRIIVASNGESNLHLPVLEHAYDAKVELAAINYAFRASLKICDGRYNVFALLNEDTRETVCRWRVKTTRRCEVDRDD